MGVLYQNFTPEDLKPTLEEHSVTGTVLVQAAPTIEETFFLLSLYEKYEWIYGIVGWLDLLSPDFKEQLHLVMQKQGLVGIRPMLQDIEQSDWILQERVIENLMAFTQYDLPVDLLITGRHIPFIETLLEILPNTRFVIDHIAKPEISKHGLKKWKEDMNKLSRFPNVWCKLSGFMTLQDSWQISSFIPYIHHTVQAFGPSRLMFGSDWPVCLSGGSYEKAIQIVSESLPDTLSDIEINQLFSINAKKFYKLKPRRVKNEADR